MEIGILTFHYGYNYGGVMQAYALQKYLASLGHSVRIIDYKPQSIKTRPYWRQLASRNLSLTKVYKIIKKMQYASNLKDSFHSFRKKYLNLSDPVSYESLSNITDEYDAIIVGSDQVWGPSQHEIGSYFLTHLNSFKGKRISYAPCCAYNKVNPRNKSRLQYALNKFSSISVRNEETENFVVDLIRKKPPIVVDPTLLWSFDELLDKKPLVEGNYILTYILGKEIHGGHINVINRLRQKHTNSKVVSIILTENHPQLFDWSDKTFWFASPIEWLSLFYYASFIYTDSFHGVLFSIKFKKPFLAYYAEMARASRFLDLASRFDCIANNIVNGFDDATKKDSFNRAINYNKLRKSFQFEIELSQIYIESALKL